MCLMQKKKSFRNKIEIVLTGSTGLLPERTSWLSSQIGVCEKLNNHSKRGITETANCALLSFEQYGPISGENLSLLRICSCSPSNKTVETKSLSFKQSSSSYKLHFFSVPFQKKNKIWGFSSFGIQWLLWLACYFFSFLYQDILRMESRNPTML